MQRISIARAMMHDPKCSFWTSRALGSIRKRGCCYGRSCANTTRQGRTILLTTHNMEEADTLCRQLGHHRSWATSSPRARPAELKASIPGGFLLRLRFAQHSAALLERLATLPGVTEVRASGEADADLYARARRFADSRKS